MIAKTSVKWDLEEISWVTPMAIRRLLRLIKIKKLFNGKV